ncbi:MAG TPA: GNAT family N-acetyltransferase [Acetobacteraceae bacterium]|nr:GNAT family N-acetyltransferase [Acetobacteraceae bacterium]
MQQLATSTSQFPLSRLVVRRPACTDVTGLAALFAEMQSHYGRPVSEARAREAAALACRPPAGTFDPHVLLAALDQTIVGSLVMNVTFPAFELTRSLYIRDLYVSAAMRRHGVGQALVHAGARLALENGYSALEWTTDSANAAARNMYENAGAARLERTYYRLFDEALQCAAV